MPTRAGPYLMGMYVAYCHLCKKDLEESKPMYYLSQLVIVAIAFLGTTPYIGAFALPPLVNFIWTCVGRHVFAICLCHPLYFFLRDGNRFLASKIWLPIANISYSMYLIHITVLTLVARFDYFKSDEEKEIGLYDQDKKKTVMDTGCPVTSGEAWQRIGFVASIGFVGSILWAIFGFYIIVEKPIIDARQAFERKASEKLTQIKEGLMME